MARFFKKINFDDLKKMKNFQIFFVRATLQFRNIITKTSMPSLSRSHRVRNPNPNHSEKVEFLTLSIKPELLKFKL